LGRLWPVAEAIGGPVAGMIKAEGRNQARGSAAGNPCHPRAAWKRSDGVARGLGRLGFWWFSTGTAGPRGGRRRASTRTRSSAKPARRNGVGRALPAKPVWLPLAMIRALTGVGHQHSDDEHPTRRSRPVHRPEEPGQGFSDAGRSTLRDPGRQREGRRARRVRRIVMAPVRPGGSVYAAHRQDGEGVVGVQTSSNPRSHPLSVGGSLRTARPISRGEAG
jgi:hypothetical protein